MTYIDNYNNWKAQEFLSYRLRKELETMREKEKKDAFGSNLEFGTAGMRGILGAGTNRINIYTVRKATVGFAKYLLEKYKENIKVAIAYDNRHMSYEFAFESAKVLATFGIKSYIFYSLRPTPELSFAVRHLNCAGGIMITASHNPKEYNGYKVYDNNGCQLMPSETEKITNYINEVENEFKIKVFSNSEVIPYITWINEDIDKEYFKKVKNISLNPDLDKVNFKIVFSPSHGAANNPVTKILTECGYKVFPVLEQCTPDPDYTNTKSPNPESADSFELAIKQAKKIDADLIIVTDPDGDRLGIGVKHNNEYVLMTGNQSCAVLFEYLLSQLKNKNEIPDNAIMFNTIVTSDLGELIANKYNVETEKTLTGFKFIGNKIEEYNKSKEKTFIFGYEESYGCLIKDFVRDKDAVQAALFAAEAGVYYSLQSKTLIDVLNDLYNEFGYFQESQISINKSIDKIKALMNKLRKEKNEELAGIRIIKVEDYLLGFDSLGNKINLPKSDVLKFYLEDGSWIAIRPSGTEPKCKIYFSVKGEKTALNDKTKKLQDAIIEIIKN